MKRRKGRGHGSLKFLLLAFAVVFVSSFVFSAPVGPDSLDLGTNETGVATGTQMINISGGYIQNLTLTANTQNPRWKAFLGEVVGSFTLDDASGSTIYDWTLSTVTGKVFATRASGSITWASINCSNLTYMEAENTALSHSNIDDNISATFDDTTHDAFYVGAVSIGANQCPTLNTYVNNVTNVANTFEEMVLYDGTNTVYATILEEDSTGYDGNSYDFQMLVPENGSAGYSGATAYYLYVELGV